mmetsp:Transcript_47582/g.81873  ORF Transcript_47582/g.81873 Transcript_47582/m.81873 type:complete len:91 (+) Transcript_47582:327-599(+)
MKPPASSNELPPPSQPWQGRLAAISYFFVLAASSDLSFFLHSVVDFFSNIIIDTIMVVDEFFSTLPSSHQNKYLTITSHRGSHLLRGPGG